MRAAWIAKKMDGKLPSLFKTLPRQPYTVEPVPAYIAPKYTGGRYNGAPIEATRSRHVLGQHLRARDPAALQPGGADPPRGGSRATTCRARLPQELTRRADLPPLRLHLRVRRRLGPLLGVAGHGGRVLHRIPTANFGRLTYEMWRACRLVVDTGLHAKGWTRQQAIDYLAANTALSLHEVETETDRYISWPGQALAYKMGELKIRELRATAEKELGDRVRRALFHDALLESGSVPLPVLERHIARFIAERKAEK